MVPRSRRPWKMTVSASASGRLSTLSATAAESSASSRARARRSSAFPSSCCIGQTVANRVPGNIGHAARFLEAPFDMKLLDKPCGIGFGVLAGLLSKRLFMFVWSKCDDEDPPKATTRYAPLTKVLAAAAVEGITFKVTRAAVDRAGARGFDHLTGVWPGEKVPDPE